MKIKKIELTNEFRVVKSFLEMLKVEVATRTDNDRRAVKFSNMKPGYRQSVTIELDTLPVEMLTVVDQLIRKNRVREIREDDRGPSRGTLA